jgi:hypothetical protein
MITRDEIKDIAVPCKNNFTGSISVFVVQAYSFSHAKKLLEGYLDMRWIIGYESW